MLRELRQRDPELPVVILSARSDLPTKLRGFELGANDYVAKPFALDELLARIRAQLRAASRRRTATTLLRAGALVLDLARRQARLGDARHRPVATASSGCSTTSPCTRARSSAASGCSPEVWGYHFDPGSNVVDVCVRRLRKKLGADAPIETVRHAGYRLAAA